MRAWKEVRAGSPQHWKKPRIPNEGLEKGCCVAACKWQKLRFPNEGLEGGAGWQPAAQFPNESAAWQPAAPEEAGRRVLRGLQHWKKPRFPNEGLEGGAGWKPAALGRSQAKIPE